MYHPLAIYPSNVYRVVIFNFLEHTLFITTLSFLNTLRIRKSYILRKLTSSPLLFTYTYIYRNLVAQFILLSSSQHILI